MPNHVSATKVTVSLQDLDRMIRKAIREEFSVLVQKKGDVFSLEQGMPLYDDLKEIASAKKRGKVKLYSRKETFGDA